MAQRSVHVSPKKADGAWRKTAKDGGASTPARPLGPLNRDAIHQ